MKKIGKVVHYFDKIMVAVVKLSAGLKVGDTVQFSGHKLDFTQTISSMEVDHKPVASGKKGDEVAMKVDNVAKEGMELSK